MQEQTLAAPPTGPAATTAKGRYAQLELLREPYLRRARQCAVVTIPSVMPPLGSTGNTDLPTPYQSVGAEGVNNISSKLLLSQFPHSSAFFRLEPVAAIRRALRAAGGGDEQADGKDVNTELQTILSGNEKEVTLRMEQRGVRAPLYEAFRHLMIAGNVLIEEMDGGKLRLHHLDKYVVKRDHAGTPLEIIVLQKLSRRTLPEAALRIVVRKDAEVSKQGDDQETVELYTRIVRRGKMWHVYQEVLEEIVEESRGTYPLDKSAWIVLRLTRIDGEDYGRGYVEQFLGDLESYETLSQAIVELSAAIAKLLIFVKPDGQTTKEDVARAENGQVVDGDANDVTAFALGEKVREFQAAHMQAATIEKRLQRVFLLMSGVQRDAERVTAEEIRALAQELETALGGMYSLLAQELQMPIARRYLHIMRNELVPLPEGTVEPQIVTGLAALGRYTDVQKQDLLVKDLAATFGQEAVAEWVNIPTYIKRRAAALSYDSAGLINSAESVAQMRQARAVQEATLKLGGPAMAAETARQKNENAA